MSLNSKLHVLILSVSLFTSFTLKGAPLPSVSISADSYNSSPDGVSELAGNVRVARNGEVITCDKASVNNKTGDVTAEGRVTMITPKDYVRAEKMTYNFLTKKGVFTNGFIQTGQETIEGEEITKLGDSQFLANSASYTSCVNCPAGWKLSGSKIDATVGGYAYVTSPLFRVYSIPVLWLPWIAIPIKNERQSGLLAPSFTARPASNGGTSYGESYFWAISESKDATFTGTYYEQRGLKGGLEYRFVSDKNSSGTFNSSYINDKFFPQTKDFLDLDGRYSKATPVPPRSDTKVIPRYFVKYNQHMELPEGYTNNMNLNMVSDTRYLYDFPNEVTGIGDPALENRINFSKNTENTHSSIDVDIYENLLRVDPIGQNEYAIHRAPELKFSLLPQKMISQMQFGLDFNYVNFVGSGNTYFDNGGTSLNDPRYMTGQRLITHPYIAVPLNAWDWMDLVPQVEYDEAFYQFGYTAKPTASRRYVRTSINAKTRLSAIYGGENPQATKYKHEMIPEITYSVVPYFYQETHPFFGSSNQFFQNGYSSTQPITEYDKLQFDYRDRLADRNYISYGITNKLIRKKIDGSQSEYKEILLHKLSQSYDFYTLSQGGTRPHSEIRSLLELKLDSIFLNSSLNFYPYENITESATNIGIKSPKGNSISVGYSQGFPFYYTPGVSTPLVGLASQSISLTTNFLTKYLDFAGTVAFDMLNRRVNSYNLASLFKPPGKCWGLAVSVIKVYGIDPTITFSLPIYFGEGRSFDVSRPGTN